jgi:hypothetical protein
MKRSAARQNDAEDSGLIMSTTRNLLTRPKLLLLLGIVALAAGGWWLYRYTTSPVDGVIQAPSQPEPQTKAVSVSRFSGQNFRLEHPAYYSSIENHSKAAPKSILEQYLLSMRGNGTESRQVSILIKQGNAASMAEDSAYVFRRSHADYKVETTTLHDQQIQKSTKKDNSEIAYFVSGKAAYAIIVATSTNPGEAFWKEAGQIIESFAWDE